MDRPHLARSLAFLGRFQVIVEPDEIEGRADPRDAGDQMQPAQPQIEPFGDVHRRRVPLVKPCNLRMGPVYRPRPFDKVQNFAAVDAKIRPPPAPARRHPRKSPRLPWRAKSGSTPRMTNAAPAPVSTRASIGAIIAASSGNLVEWFDFYVYAFCSVYFAAAFFPKADATGSC
jgi:hypothetical protein